MPKDSLLWYDRHAERFNAWLAKGAWRYGLAGYSTDKRAIQNC